VPRGPPPSPLRSPLLLRRPNGSIADGVVIRGLPAWGGAGEARGVFKPINVTGPPVRLGVPRFVDLGPDLAYSPDGRAYLIAKGCSSNDGLHCSFMTGDMAFLARTVLPVG